LDKFIWPVGAKHKGKPILEILRTNKRYLEWAADNMTAPGLKKKALEALQTLQGTRSTPQALTSPDQVTSASQGKVALPPLKRVLPPIMRPSSDDDRAPWE